MLTEYCWKLIYGKYFLRNNENKNDNNNNAIKISMVNLIVKVQKCATMLPVDTTLHSPFATKALNVRIQNNRTFGLLQPETVM